MYDHLKDVIFPVLDETKAVDLVIGTNHPWFHASLQEIEGGPNQPIARLTRLGWTAIGPMCPDSQQQLMNMAVYTSCLTADADMDSLDDTRKTNTDDQLDQLFRLLWYEEEPAKVPDQTTPLEQIAFRRIEATRKVQNKKYEVGAIWKKETKPDLPNNYEAVKKQRQQHQGLIKKGGLGLVIEV